MRILAVMLVVMFGVMATAKDKPEVIEANRAYAESRSLEARERCAEFITVHAKDPDSIRLDRPFKYTWFKSVQTKGEIDIEMDGWGRNSFGAVLSWNALSLPYIACTYWFRTGVSAFHTIRGSRSGSRR